MIQRQKAPAKKPPQTYTYIRLYVHTECLMHVTVYKEIILFTFFNRGNFLSSHIISKGNLLSIINKIKIDNISSFFKKINFYLLNKKISSLPAPCLDRISF